jgi:hypothetical protein
MKTYKNLLLLFVFVFFSANIFAQRTRDMTKDEWKNEIEQLSIQKTSLTSTLTALKSEIAGLTKTRDGLQSYEDCINGIYSMLGVTKKDVDNFRRQLSELSSKIDAQQVPKADRQAELDAMKKNKISALPEFFDTVHDQLQKKLDAWEEKPKEITYSVVIGDCLWNIAKKKEHYSNPFAWPVIYKANRDQIKNPDLIFPKQIFNIPQLSDDEMTKYNKIRRNYKPAPPAQTQTQSTH